MNHLKRISLTDNSHNTTTLQQFFIVTNTNFAIRMAIFWLPLFVIINRNLISFAANDPYFNCYSNGNSTIDSQYSNFRNSLLSNLADQVKNSGGYYGGDIITSSPTTIPFCFGLCRKDLISSDACYTCISASASVISHSCPVQYEVIGWGADADCIVKCNPEKLKLNTTQPPSKYSCNTTTLSKSYLTQFRLTLATLSSKLAVKAGDYGSSSSFPFAYNEPQYFATEEAKLGDHLTIYAAGFCVPSISKSACTACLKSAANQSAVDCDGKQGASVFMGSCVLRYELYKFYKSLTIPNSVAPSPPTSPSSQKNGRTESRKTMFPVVIAVGSIVTLIVFVIGITMVLNRRKKRLDPKDDMAGVENVESCFEFSFNTIRVATNGFSESNKLGEGGFGTVYKGTLSNGLLIAVKRLTRATPHGDAEFKNEVQLVAKLHHRNLVRLIGFCLGIKERILIYELAPNGSLNHILFDANRREGLSWNIRYNIIKGVAHGLLYLHEESQLKIIHRDLKASNVLLDESMIPKISDFGTARLFVEDQGSASKIVGTYGYMPPEYAKFGKISTKVDVFGFGVLLLEIVSGTYNSERMDHLISKVWKCWTQERLREVIDPVLLREGGRSDDITQCIHLGLLCVQEKVACRPTMSEVVLVLEGCSQILPPPSEPAYLMEIESSEPRVSAMGNSVESRITDSDADHPTGSQLSLSSAGFSSINEVSFTHTYPEPR